MPVIHEVGPNSKFLPKIKSNKNCKVDTVLSRCQVAEWNDEASIRVWLKLHHLPCCVSKILQIMATLSLFTLHSVDCFALKSSADNQCSDCGSVQIWLFHSKDPRTYTVK